MAAPGTLDLTHVNYEALTRPITSAEVRAFRAQIRAEQRANPSIDTGLQTATSVFTIVFLVVFIGIFGFVFVSAIAGIALDGSGGGSGAWLLLLFVAAMIAVVIILIVRHFGSGGSWGRWMRLSQFAADNGLQFRSRSANPGYAGMIFQLGDARFSSNHLNSTTGRYFDLGTFQYSTGSGKSRTTHYWGFLALQLDRKLPNMVLDSKENNTLFGSDLPITFRRDQILSLEGDFNKHFTLYCPQEYEQDALYVFTPDLMALLIDEAGSYDVEIVDDWMFIYSPHQFPQLDARNYARLFTIVETVGAKTVSQTSNYHDDRVGSATADIVAPAGQRLRHGTSIGALVIGVLLAGFWLYSMFGGFGN
ncbi:MAG TPA: hypothetical protein VGF80_05820 [Galbitalea sp.]|jgi:hypothetical protein